MDFRALDVGTFKWTSTPSRKWILAPPLRVQTPIAKCSIRDTAQFQSIQLQLHDDNFLAFMSHVEAMTRESIPKPEGIVDWCSSVNAWGEMRLTGFDDTLYFDVHGEVMENPLHIQACAALIEVTGMWSSMNMESGVTRMGLRWKLLQIKQQSLSNLYVFVDDDDDNDDDTVH